MKNKLYNKEVCHKISDIENYLYKQTRLHLNKGTAYFLNFSFYDDIMRYLLHRIKNPIRSHYEGRNKE